MNRIGIVVLAIYAVLSWQRIGIWENDRMLWEDAVRLDPHLPRPWINAGSHRMRAGDVQGAVHAWLYAYRWSDAPWLTKPEARAGRITVLMNLGSYYSQHGDLDAAARCFEEAYRIQASPHAFWSPI